MSERKNKDVLTLDQLRGLLGIEDSLDELIDYNLDFLGEVYSGAYKYALQEAEEDDLTEDEAEEYAQEEAQKAEGEAARKLESIHIDAVEEAADKIFEQHGLELERMKDGRYRVEAEESWEEAADKVVDTVNGVGSFGWYEDVDEFIEVTSSDDARDAVLSNLHWLKERPSVYGTGASAVRIYESSFEHGVRHMNPSAPPQPNPKETKKLKSRLLR